MRPIARNAYVVLAWLFVAGLVTQVFLAGLGVFSNATSFATHRDFGYMLEIFPVLLLLVGLVAGLGRRMALIAVGIFGLFILQSVFVALRSSAPSLAALHPVNGFLILLVALYVARAARLHRSGPVPGSERAAPNWPGGGG